MTDGTLQSTSRSNSSSPRVTILFFWSSGTLEFSNIRATGSLVHVFQEYMPQQGQNWIDLPEITNIFSRYTKSLLFKSIDDLDIQAAQIFLRIRDRESGGELTEPEYLFDAKQNFIYALSRVFEDVTDQDLLNEAEKAMNRNQLNQQKDIKIWAGTLAKDLGKFTD